MQNLKTVLLAVAMSACLPAGQCAAEQVRNFDPRGTDMTGELSYEKILLPVKL
jgi:hypothetical protein